MPTRPARLLLAFSLAGLALGAASAQRRPLPTVQPPGAVQPVAPGQRPGAPLPTLDLSPPIPAVRRVEWASNGFIEVAHALVLVPKREEALARDLQLAIEAVKRTYAARPGLAEVDVSVYLLESYEGFGGPLPKLTASVPRDRLEEFRALKPATLPGYERAWNNPSDTPNAPRRTPNETLETNPTFVGAPNEVRGQQVQQLASQLVGGVRGGLFFHGDPGRPLAALTFDDAPHPLYEPLLLDALRRARVRATFFCIGRNARAYPYFVLDMVRDGHEVANHTFHHVRLPGLPEAEVRDELEGANRVLTGITGLPVRYFRAPGSDSPKLTLRVSAAPVPPTVFWTDDPGDFDNLGDLTLRSRLLSKLRRGGIVLLHDNVLETIQVLPEFLRAAGAQRLELTTVGRLAGAPS